jgi:hypothetical protein
MELCGGFRADVRIGRGPDDELAVVLSRATLSEFAAILFNLGCRTGVGVDLHVRRGRFAWPSPHHPIGIQAQKAQSRFRSLFLLKT